MFAKIFISIFMGFFCFLFFLCTTKDGITFEEGQGKIWVQSQNIDSARIFLDYKDTGELTPALLENIVPGEHVIHLFRSTYRPTPDSVLILLEENAVDTASFTLAMSPNGNLNIESTPDSARVFLNKLEFGLTPFSLTGIPEDQYFLQLIKSNFDVVSDTIAITDNGNLNLSYQLQEDIRRFVLLEHFSNSSCPPCPQSDEIIDSLARDYGPARLVVLAYHANFPGSDDPMYLSAMAGNDSRLNYYKPPSIPRAFVDGRLVSDPQSAPSYTGLIDDQALQDTAATIAFKQLNRSANSIQGRLEITALKNISQGHRLFIALIEDEIDYASPPGSNGQTHFEAVLRDFYPDGEGVDINLSVQQSLNVTFNFTLAGECGADLTVLAFIQNVSSKAVLQSGWTRYPPF
jgi:thiol-disulfide isomerase/thioredoxin